MSQKYANCLMHIPGITMLDTSGHTETYAISSISIFMVAVFTCISSHSNIDLHVGNACSRSHVSTLGEEVDVCAYTISSGRTRLCAYYIYFLFNKLIFFPIHIIVDDKSRV